jgi:hypothetical protein
MVFESRAICRDSDQNRENGEEEKENGENEEG